MAALTARVVPTSAGPIEVYDAGRGPAVLVLHGMPGDWRQGLSVAEDLGAQARVLLVSRPGYGRTPLSSGRTQAASADLCAALLDVLDVPDAVVLGISGGGPSSYAFAVRHPQRCAGLLLCCALQSRPTTPPSTMVRLAAVPGVWSALAAVTRAAARVRSPRCPPVGTYTPAEQLVLADPAARAALDRFTRDQPSWTRGRGLRNDTRQMLTAGEPRAWPTGLTPRAVVLHGDLDEIIPLSHAEDYARRIPGATLEVLPGLGHAVPLFARHRLTDLLRDLRGLPAE